MGCRPYCRDTKTCPVVPRHALVSFVSGQSSKVCHKVALKALNSLISLCSIFLSHTVLLQQIVIIAHRLFVTRLLKTPNFVSDRCFDLEMLYFTLREKLNYFHNQILLSVINILFS